MTSSTCKALITTAPLAALAAILLGAAPASATTFCVPGYHPACPNNGANVATASLESAFALDYADGVADRIVIAAGTLTGTGTHDLDFGTDDLEIVGAGPQATTLTATPLGSGPVLKLAGDREVTVRDLTIEIPASAPDGSGSAALATGDTFENVDFRSLNPGSSGARMVGGGNFRDGRVYGSMGGSIAVGFGTDGAQTGPMVIARSSIEQPEIGVRAGDGEVVTRVRRTRIVDPAGIGVWIASGGIAVVDNSIIESDVGTPVYAQSTTSSIVIGTVRHSTIAGTPANPQAPAIRATVMPAVGHGSINLVVSDTIVAGYQQPLRCEAPAANNIGDANLTVGYSYFFHSADTSGDCNLSISNSIDATSAQYGPPQFLGPGDYRLPPGSPAIDSGNPQNAALPTEDYDGLPRPIDGDGDGVARRDMGAHEYQPPDETVTIAIKGKKATLTSGGRLEAKLVCPAAEVSGPCDGTLKLAAAKRVALGGKRRKVTFGTKAFSIAAGQTKAVAVKLSKRNVRLLQRKRAARTLKATAKVADQAGNEANVVKKLRTRIEKA